MAHSLKPLQGIRRARRNNHDGQRRQERDGAAGRKTPSRSLPHRRAATGLSRCELSDPQASPRRPETPKESPLPGKGTGRPVGANWIMERLIGSRNRLVIRLMRTVDGNASIAGKPLGKVSSRSNRQPPSRSSFRFEGTTWIPQVSGNQVNSYKLSADRFLVGLSGVIYG